MGLNRAKDQRKFLVEDDRNTAFTGFGGSLLDALYICKATESGHVPLIQAMNKLYSTNAQAPDP